MTTSAPPPFPWLSPHGPGWTCGVPERVTENPWFAVDAYEAVAPTGAPAGYFVQHYKNLAVGVLPLHDDGTVSLVGQWRFPFGAYSWEIPEGGAPLHEDPLEGAERELREETGLAASDWRLVLRMQLSNSSSDEACFGYLATGLTAGEAEPEATEALALIRVPFRELLHAVVSGAVQDSITVAMVLRAHHLAVEGELDASLAAMMLQR